MFKSRYVPVLHVNSTNLLCMSHVYPVSHHWFKLWQIWLLINFLIKQEIAKTSEHIAIKSIFLWKVDHRAVLQRVLDDLYHAATNLCLRHAHEIQKEQEVSFSSLKIQLIWASCTCFSVIC
jgi:hypothetical protein